jgi:hypothetical protein
LNFTINELHNTFRISFNHGFDDHYQTNDRANCCCCKYDRAKIAERTISRTVHGVSPNDIELPALSFTVVGAFSPGLFADDSFISRNFTLGNTWPSSFYFGRKS